MQIVPVIDLARGRAVHAVGGDRNRYQPVRSLLTGDASGNPLILLQAIRRHFGLGEIYLADLDAIQGGPIQRATIRELAAERGALVVDAGTWLPGGALDVLSCGPGQVVIGLETLRSFGDLAAIVRALGPERIWFSLDLKMGRPLLHPALGSAASSLDVAALVRQATATGVGQILLLDLGRVGSGEGVDLRLLEGLRRLLPAERLWVGGGVRGREELARLNDMGCDGALVASAIHAGRVTADDGAALRGPAQSPASTSR